MTHMDFSVADMLGPYTKFEFGLAAALVLGLAVYEWWPAAGLRLQRAARARTALRWSLDFAMILLVFVCGSYQYSPFIYFQF